MTNMIEEKLAKKIVAYMEKDPQVSVDVATRLEFSRNMALKNIKTAEKTVSKGKKAFSFDVFRSKMVWITSAASIAIALMLMLSSFEVNQVMDMDVDEINYHIQADTSFVERYSDEL